MLQLGPEFVVHGGREKVTRDGTEAPTARALRALAKVTKGRVMKY
jgi:hypothetical protein